MKKYLFLPILLIVISCTSFNNTFGKLEREKIVEEVTSTIVDLKEATNSNKYEKIEEFFLPTFKNKIIVSNIKQYDLSKLTFIFSEITPVSEVKAKGIMVINYGTESNYYNVTWGKKEIDGQWKISNVAVKK
ncbi:MAG: hypothetical protein KBA67_01645 [Leptotrichiaceae bacterium]|nr:hypothetical protein [Leptotrichiaceae bacterium]